MKTEIEDAIIRNVIRELRHAGWKLDRVDLYEGEQEKVKTEREAVDETRRVDESEIVLKKEPKQRCTVLIIRGNGLDVIADYRVTKESFEEAGHIIDGVIERAHD